MRIGNACIAMLALCGCVAEPPAGPGRITLDVEAPSGALRRPYHLDLSDATSAHGATWALHNGALPPGVRLDPAGLLQGIPTRAGFFLFTAEATWSDRSPVEAHFTLAILGGTLVEIRTAGAGRGQIAIDGERVCGARRGLRNGPCAYYDPEGGSVEMVASTDPGGVFGGWWEGCSGVGTCVVGPGDTARVVAVFGGADEPGFNIEFLGTTSYPDWVVGVIDRAAGRWELMLGDLPAVTLTQPIRCGGRQEVVTHPIDDLILLLDVTDSGGGVGASCFWPEVVGRPSPVGVVSVGAPAMSEERLFTIMSHEIGHALGFGSSPEWYAQVLGASGSQARFLGEQAQHAFMAVGAPTTGGVPLDDGIHWSAAVFGMEVMATNAGPISVVTLGALADLGYSVNVAAAEPFNLAAARIPNLPPPSSAVAPAARDTSRSR